MIHPLIPGSRPATGARSQAEAWADTIWSHHQGYAILALGHRPHLSDTGKLRHDPPYLRHSGWQWSGQRDAFLAKALTASATADVYVGVLLRDRPTRRKSDSNPMPGRWAWLDADTWDENQHDNLLAGVGTTVLSVASGSTGARHLYVELGETLPGHIVADYARRLAVQCKTDTWGGDNKLLRLPGTINHKAHLLGHPHPEVRWMT